MAAGKLRLFTTFEDKAPAAANGSNNALSGDGAHQQREQLARLAMGSSKWGALFAASTAHDMPTTALLLHCIALGYTSSKERPLQGFDRPASGGGSGGSGGASDGSLAASLAEHLVQGWWCLTSLPGWRWQLQASAAIGAALRCCATGAALRPSFTVACATHGPTPHSTCSHSWGPPALTCPVSAATPPPAAPGCSASCSCAWRPTTAGAGAGLFC